MSHIATSTINLPLGENSYKIFIGDKIDIELKRFLNDQGFSLRCMLITDENVNRLYGKYYVDILLELGYEPLLIVLPPGEQTKSMSVLEDIYSKAIKHRMDRKSVVFALGGGVIGDLAGFVAATFMRGVPFVQIPTTLLAQVDSSVGGKVAVNHTLGKNLIGAFYQPKAVFIDVTTLKTLPSREIATGMAEVIKYSYIMDASLLSFINSNREELKKLQPVIMQEIITRCCQIKADIVVADEKENGLRAILNFGHTLAHAIEAETEYKVYNHGEAVAIGMVAAGEMSVALGSIKPEVVEDMRNILKEFSLPIKASHLNIDNIYNHLFHDKKTVGGTINWILLNDLGKVYQSKAVSETIVRDIIEKVIM